MMGLEVGSEHFGLKGFHTLGTPGVIMHSVGDIADKKFFGQISGIHIGQYLLAHLSVKFGHTVDILTEICSQNTHRKLLLTIVGIDFAQRHHSPPIHAQELRELSHIASHQLIRKGIVTRRNRCMRCEKAGNPDKFKRFEE